MKPLLADLHVHTNFSDGRHSVSDIVDFFGKNKFDVIAITDHASDTSNVAGKVADWLDLSLNLKKQELYFETLRKEARRAWDQYSLLVLPGVEITKNYFDTDRSCHFLSIGSENFYDPRKSVIELLKESRNDGALNIAAHPLWTDSSWEFQSVSLWRNREVLAPYFDAWEVNTGQRFYNEVYNSGLPILASSDLHIFKQIDSWKTLVYAEKSKENFFAAIRQQKIKVARYKNYEIDIVHSMTPRLKPCHEDPEVTVHASGF